MPGRWKRRFQVKSTSISKIIMHGLMFVEKSIRDIMVGAKLLRMVDKAEK